MDNFLSFILATLALTGSPGPATLGMAAAGAAYGARDGLQFLAGVVSGMLVVITLTASGLTGLVWTLPGAAPIVSVVAAAYILYLAYRIATAQPLSATKKAKAPPSYPGGIVLALTNPKAYAAMAALFSGFVLLTGNPLADASVKTAVVMAIILLVNICWLLAGSALTRLFHDPRANRVVNVAFAVLLVGSVAFALLI